MARRIISIIIVMLLCFHLVGCGTADDSESIDNKELPATESEIEESVEVPEYNTFSISPEQLIQGINDDPDGFDVIIVSSSNWDSDNGIGIFTYDLKCFGFSVFINGRYEISSGNIIYISVNFPYDDDNYIEQLTSALIFMTLTVKQLFNIATLTDALEVLSSGSGSVEYKNCTIETDYSESPIRMNVKQISEFK